ncbi:MAG: tyrosine-type recombinase/integrase [Rhodothermaceae bacterium]|nr:tyrosine-type recombinase/integrase [Rhodothermaceae bacterium]MXZ58018.1 tyrosine-type recombinase/integrase [Rhodothermaceae bacterium]MYB91510.1 tyrosine-type recombinase/integrase [Rhodothermaceae bacterium]MYD69055.1 tyrosine-type recombinase/integrase [Rhodothermaceae bacterium]MYG43621.1 tyrosine-type recombinase/integrase [Rhodothermaceae bacterium]
MLKDRDLVKTLTTDAILARVDFFLSTLAQGKSQATVKTYGKSLEIFKLWILEQGGNVELSQENLEKFPIYLKTERHVSHATIQTYLTAVRQFFVFLVNEGLLQEDPAKNIRVKPQPRPLGRGILTEDEIKRLFKVSEGRAPIRLRDQAILCCMLRKGLSETEITKCNYEDLENTLMGEELNIRGENRRIVPLDQQTYQSLRAYLATRRQPIGPKDPLFQSLGTREKYERLKVRTVRSRMRGLLDLAMITRIEVSPQSLSHTAIYLMIQQGISKEELKEQIGPHRFYHRVNNLKTRGLIDPSY